MTLEEILKKSTSERLAEILPLLSKDQLRYVVASLDYPTKKEAAEAVALRPNTIYGWPEYVDEAIKLMAIEAADSALAIRRRNLVKAMMVKVAGLDADDDAVRQKAATEIIEWELGKAGQNIDLTTGGEKMIFEVVRKDGKGE